MGAGVADATIDEILANYSITSGGSVVVKGTGVATASAVNGDAKKVQITFTNTTGTNFDSAKTITVKTLAGGDLADANGVDVTVNGTLVTATK